MNWNEWIIELCEANECSESHVHKVEPNKKLKKKLQRRQKDIYLAAEAVKHAYEQFPTGTKDELREQAYLFTAPGYSFLYSSALGKKIPKLRDKAYEMAALSFLNVLLSVALKYAIEWFLDKVYREQPGADDDVSIPTE
jgi:hypothetical protein